MTFEPPASQSVCRTSAYKLWQKMKAIFRIVAVIFLLSCNDSKELESKNSPPKTMNDKTLPNIVNDVKDDPTNHDKNKSEIQQGPKFAATKNIKKNVKQKSEPQKDHKAPDFVHCECKILEYEGDRFYCDHDNVPKGSPHSQGRYPWVRAEILHPLKYKGKTASILFRYASFSFKNKSGSMTGGYVGDLVGKACSVKLPSDYLEGDYGMIFDSSIEDFVVLRREKEEP
ncbi:MAG: hypothetical protein GY847_28385 [Proteobacteria bacterium]|nr:hypothetical protein [Pseudomonadota bacterium]